MNSLFFRSKFTNRPSILCTPLLFTACKTSRSVFDIQMVSMSSGAEVVHPRDVHIAFDKIDFSFARCAGPGGQNVNKVNTKAELRFNVHEAYWIDHAIRHRMCIQYANSINREGELYLSSQEHRTQLKNKEVCIQKLREMIAEATPEPKEREQYEGISEKGKTKRVEFKKHRSSIKANRRQGKDDY